MSIADTLANIGPDAKIIDVQTDIHDGNFDDRCEVCLCRIFPVVDVVRLIDRVFPVPVARIVFVADGYKDGGEVLSEGDTEWPVTCESCAQEARELKLGLAKTMPAVELGKAVSQ